MNRKLEDYGEVLTVSDLMEILQIGRNNAYKLVQNKEIDVLKIGKKIRIPKQNLLHYIYKDKNVCYSNI